MICTDNAFKDLSDIKAHEMKKFDPQIGGQLTSVPNPNQANQPRRKGVLDHMAGDGGKKRARNRSTEAI